MKKIFALALVAASLTAAPAMAQTFTGVRVEATVGADDVTKLRDTDGVVDVHDVHVWQLTRGAPVFSAHVIVDDAALTDGRAARILETLQGCLADHFDVEHSTFQLEPAGHVEHDSRHA